VKLIVSVLRNKAVEFTLPLLMVSMLLSFEL
jgi:hypothetical protein